jgi:RND family efflux transporter MFP subunit
MKIEPFQNPIPNVFILAFVFIAFVSCKNKNVVQDNAEHQSLPDENNVVEIAIIHQEDFTSEIICNGKLTACLKAELWFKKGGIIDSVFVRNGQKISEGMFLSRIQDIDYTFALDKAKLIMEQAEIDRQDALLSMGYKSYNENIPIEHRKIANIRSGYNQAFIGLKEAEKALGDMILKAPFTGIVEGISQKPWEMADQSKPFCTLINDSRFSIVFSLLETEVSNVQIGQPVFVIPVAGAKSSTGSITEINPKINENGLIQVKAEVNNPGGYLEGMNVKVSIKNASPGKLVVPKQSVVLRDNREVLFRYTHGIAYWTYVKVTDENELQYAVIPEEGARLESGDTIIVSNNLNLAHESIVTIK